MVVGMPLIITWQDTPVSNGATIQAHDGSSYQIVQLHDHDCLWFVPRAAAGWGDWNEVAAPDRYDAPCPPRTRDEFRQWVDAFAHQRYRDDD